MDTEQSPRSTYMFHNPRANKLVIDFGCTTAKFDILRMSYFTITHRGTPVSISIDSAYQIHISGPGIAVSFHLEGSVVQVDIMLDTEIDSLMSLMDDISQMTGPSGLYSFTMKRGPRGSEYDSLGDKPRFGADGSFGLLSILRDLEGGGEMFPNRRGSLTD